MTRCFRGNLLSRNHTSKSYFSSPEGRANWEMDVTVKEHQGAEHWEAWRHQCRGFQQPLAWVHNQGHPKRQNRREKIKEEEYAYQDQDGACGSDLMGSSGAWLLLWMCCTRCWCLCRMKTIKPLDQAMRHKYIKINEGEDDWV